MKLHEKRQKRKWLFLFVSFTVVFVAGSILLAVNQVNREKANDIYEGMQASVNENILEDRAGTVPEDKAAAALEKVDAVLQEGADVVPGDEETVALEERASAALGNVEIAALEGETDDASGDGDRGTAPAEERRVSARLVKAVQEAAAKVMAASKEAQAEAAEEVLDEEGQGEAAGRADVSAPGKKLDWDALHKECADIYAWIYVPGTTVDYPVLQHPTSNAYYLDHNMDGSKGYPGCIYTENYNSKSFSDLHTVVYGHNLKDKTMFSSLHNFENNKMVQEPHYIYIYTESGQEFVYEIFAAYEFPAIHLLDNYDLSNEYVYEQYIKDIFNMENKNMRVANIRHDIEVTKKDRIITLSTCTSDHDASLRFLVVGVLR